MVPLLPDTGGIETIWATVFIIVAGILGALVREILDGGLKLPSVKDSVLNLGFLGSIIIGGAAGFFLGDSLIGSFNAGLTASVILQGIISKTNKSV